MGIHVSASSGKTVTSYNNDRILLMGLGLSLMSCLLFRDWEKGSGSR
jgi:hypothetical protein